MDDIVERMFEDYYENKLKILCLGKGQEIYDARRGTGSVVTEPTLIKEDIERCIKKIKRYQEENILDTYASIHLLDPFMDVWCEIGEISLPLYEKGEVGEDYLPEILDYLEKSLEIVDKDPDESKLFFSQAWEGVFRLLESRGMDLEEIYQVFKEELKGE